jgi:3-oxoadipate enol-lactonase
MSIGDDDIEQAWQQRMLSHPPARLARALGVLMGADDISERTSTITAPALVIHGELDQPIPISRGHELALALPNSAFLSVAGHGHTPPLTAASAVAEAIAEFGRKSTVPQ